MNYDTALDLPRDEDGRIVGYAIGREARMRDWLHRRDRADFEKLVARLRAAKWWREAKHDPEKRARKYAAIARYQAKPGVRAKINARQNAKRRAAYKRAPIVLTCEVCGATWCKVPWVRGVRPRFCGQACQKRAWSRKTA